MSGIIENEIEKRVEAMTFKEMGYRIDELVCGEVCSPFSAWHTVDLFRARIKELGLIAHRLRRIAAGEETRD